MELSSVGFKNLLVQKTNGNNSNTNGTSNLKLKPQLSQDSVQFTGAAKCLSNAYDKAFVDILSKDLELTKEGATKLKNLVWNFLRERKIQSLEEIGGEDFIEEQGELSNKIMKKLNLPEDASEFVVREVCNRCDEGEKYIPGGLIDFNKDKELEEYLMNMDGRKYLLGTLEYSADKEFFEYIRKALRLTPTENYEFKATIDNYLKENNLKSINDLAGMDMVNEQAELVELLERKFNLSEAETNAVKWELISRANSAYDYKPIANLFVKDEASIDAVVNNGGYNYIVDKNHNIDFSTELFRVMSNEAKESGYKNIFEIFNPSNKPLKSKTVEFIKGSKLSKEEQTDLIIDLSKVAKAPEEFAENIPKHVGFDNFYGSFYSDIITEKIMQKYGLPSIVEEDINKIISKLHPKHVAGGEGCSAEQIAFEIADKYGLPGNAEKELCEIITETFSEGPKGADVYIINKLMNE